MPAKPIKHGIKVFALCCSYTGYLYSYVVYTGKNNTEGLHTAVDVVKFLLQLASCTAAGRILYTDNYYTSAEVMKFVFLSYGMPMMVGTCTYKLSKKKSCTANDFPFAKISNSTLGMVKRGWS